MTGFERFLHAEYDGFTVLLRALMARLVRLSFIITCSEEIETELRR